MKTTIDYMGDALKEFKQEKEQNFGSIPDDYRRFIEESLEHPGPVALTLTHMVDAVKEFPKFLSSMKEQGHAKTVAKNDDMEVNALELKLGGDGLDFKKLIRTNWEFFEPPFYFLYIGMKMGREMEKHEREELGKIAAREDRRKANPNAFDSIGPAPEKLIMLPAVSDTPELPAISPERAAQFRKEMEAELKAEQDSGESTDKAA